MTSIFTGPMCWYQFSANGMAVALAAKMVLLFGSLLDSWRQVVSPFRKWWWWSLLAPTFSLIFDPSVYTSSCGPRSSRYSLNLVWASSLVIIHLLTPSMRLCLLRSYSCVPGGKVGVFRRQTISTSISAEVKASCTLGPIGCAGGRVIPLFLFGLGRYRSRVAGSNSCSAWCAGLSVQARIFR